MPWVVRCASRLIELDGELGFYEAAEIAVAMLNFERTGAMAPEAAAEFVAQQMSSPQGPRLDRRVASTASRVAD